MLDVSSNNDVHLVSVCSDLTELRKMMMFGANCGNRGKAPSLIASVRCVSFQAFAPLVRSDGAELSVSGSSLQSSHEYNHRPHHCEAERNVERADSVSCDFRADFSDA